MRNLRVVLYAVVVSLLAVPAVQAELPWTFDVQPIDGAALPGNTIQWTYDITNNSTTDSLTIVGAGAAWFPPFPSAHVAEDAPDFIASPASPVTVGPGATSSGDFYHLTWAPTAPLGTTASGGMFVSIQNRDAEPPHGITIPITATATPELPPGALGLLSFLPYGMWRLRMRKKT
ncbi:MAG: hypothetical protein PVH68_01800 [Armatimonadota bacterium]|jgi:hypothetical protein